MKPQSLDTYTTAAAVIVGDRGSDDYDNDDDENDVHNEECVIMTPVRD